MRPVKRRAVTRRYRSSCRDNRWRSDAYGRRAANLVAMMDLTLSSFNFEESATERSFPSRRQNPGQANPPRKAHTLSEFLLLP
jgi:hypothetical protein